jgi:GH25 family lysozyme M1 (1,4-beta-N-acetylmuramidase)
MVPIKIMDKYSGQHIGFFEKIYHKLHSIFYPPKIEPQVLDPNIFGFDFSKWQGVIDFKKVSDYGAKFLILRTSYGITKDERFDEYMQTVLFWFAKFLGVYHYYDPIFSPMAQAQKVIATLAPYKGSIKRVYGDFEFGWSGNYSSSANWKIFAEEIIKAGYKFGVYTRATWWDSRVGNLASWFGQFPVWAAQYSSALTLIPKGWSNAQIWQKGTPVIGKEVGTQSLEVDYNVMDNEFYKSEYGEVIEPPPPPTGGNMNEILEGTLLRDLNSRGGPGVEYSLRCGSCRRRR